MFPVALLALLALSWTCGTRGRAAEAPDPWTVLEELRDNLAAQPMTARFVQTYQPAGFASGDQETGYLYLSLPRCARWDYDEPFPKVFLLCDETIHTWNPGEQAGRRYILTNGDEPGIDLLRLQTDDLRPRYEARIDSDPGDPPRILLTPRQEDQTLVEAEITMDLGRRLLLALSYRDREGNASRFEIEGYEPFETTNLFEPPRDLDWLDQ